MGMLDSLKTLFGGGEETDEEKKKQEMQAMATATPQTTVPTQIKPRPRLNTVDTISAHSNPDTAASTPDKNVLRETSMKMKVSGTEDDPQGPTNNLKSKILPMILRFALPAVAGAAIGGKGSIGALAGGLGGLAAGGTGYLKDQQLAEKNNLNKDKFSKEVGLKERDVAARELRARKYQGGGGRGSSDELKMLPQQNAMEAVLRARNGEEVDINDPEELKNFANQARVHGLKITEDQTNWLGNYAGQKEKEDLVKGAAEVYNQMVRNPQNVKGSMQKNLKIGNSPVTTRVPMPTKEKRKKPSYTVEDVK